jgi:MFS family permease
MQSETHVSRQWRRQELRRAPAASDHGLATFPRRILPWIEPWFLAYACLGVVQGGMLPLLLPLSAGGFAHAGVIVGVMNLAGVAAPVWGHLADRRRLHREVLLAGVLMVLAALLLMPAPLGLPVKIVLAAILGLGFAAANTVANMFIVEVRPPEEWDARIGALQALSGGGQVAGLLIAGFIGGRYALAFGVAAGLVAAALPIAWMTLRGVQVPVPRMNATAHAALGGEVWVGAPQRVFHLISWRGIRTLLREMEMPFARLLTGWFFAFGAIGAVLTVFPLSLIERFGASPRLPATTYAFAAAVSLSMYPLAAKAARTFGAPRVLTVGLAARIIAGATLGAAFLSPAGNLPLFLAVAGFVTIVLAWPLLSVSATVWAAQLAPGEEGDALGLFNATSSLAGAVGAFAGGLVSEQYGYGMVCLACVAIIIIAVPLLGKTTQAQPA